MADIACLRVVIYRLENRNDREERTSLELDDFFKVNPVENFRPKHKLAHIPEKEFKYYEIATNYIQISNDFEKGKYEILYGFMFKIDLIEPNPTFYCKSCIVTKQ